MLFRKLDQTGFSLPGIIIAMLIGSGLMLASMRTIRDTQVGLYSEMNRYTVSLIKDEIRRIFESPTACANSLVTPGPFNPTPVSPLGTQFNEIRNLQNQVVYQRGGDPVGERNLTLTNLLVSDYQAFDPVTDPTRGSARLRMEFRSADPDNPSVLSNIPVLEELRISVSIDSANNITDCTTRPAFRVYDCSSVIAAGGAAINKTASCPAGKRLWGYQFTTDNAIDNLPAIDIGYSPGQMAVTASAGLVLDAQALCCSEEF